MTDSTSDVISNGRCRELIGAEADGLLREQIAAVRDHADAMAPFVVDLFSEQHAARIKDDDASGV